MFHRIIKFMKVAFTSLFENKVQAFLTMLGIIIGIGAVIAVLSIGKGAESLILNTVESFGSRSIFIQPGGGDAGPPSPTAIDKIKWRDYQAIQDLDFLEDIAPLLIYGGTIAYGSEVQNVRIIGSSQFYLDSLSSRVEEGRNFDQLDIDLSSRVVLLGAKMPGLLFGDIDPIGKKVKINNKTFTVVGVMEKQGFKFFQDFDTRIVIPITTMRSQIHGVDYVTTILGNVKEDYPMQEAMQDLREIIRKRHGINNPENDFNKDDFRVVSQADAAEVFQGIADALKYFLVMVAAISLLVGGIGIMNIMFVSVTERTREIGLRKAVGATNRDIMLQFMIEAIVITFVAGVIGVIAGLVGSYLITRIIQTQIDDWEFIITLDSIVWAFTVSVLIGLIFGIYPARKASKMNPIVALRIE